ncbi:protein affected trafficking 2 [Wolffia australiana]
MFPQLGASAGGLSKASGLVFRIGTDAHLYDDPDDVSIAPLLDSNFESEKTDALKRLLALIAQGEDVSSFFPQVVKNMSTPSLEVKKLVYLYLLHYAEKRQNEALLSINCFQKDLSDVNPLVRAWALRTLSGIRLHTVAPIVLVALRKCVKDPSSYVRKCAANALSKLNDLQLEENASSLEELVSILLNDRSPGVVGAAAAAFNIICPNNLSLVGKNFKRLSEIVPDVDEWGQVVLINILLRYIVARHGLVEESIISSTWPPDESYSKNESYSTPAPGFVPLYEDVEPSELQLRELMFRNYIEGWEKYSSKLSEAKDDGQGTNNSTCFASAENSEIQLLLQCTSPLLWSQNSAVVLAAATVHWILGSKMKIKNIVKPVLFLLRSSYASKYVVLRNIQIFAKAMPSLFAAFYEDFFVSSSDSYQMKILKLDILSTIITESSVASILEEFQDYFKDPDRKFAVDVVAAISVCAKKVPTVAKTCLERLLDMVKQESSILHCGSFEAEAGILVQAIMSIKTIIKQDTASYEKVIVVLIRCLDKIKEASARALIIWIAGEYCHVGDIIPKIIPTVVCYLGQCFSSEELEAKNQIMNTAAKVALKANGEEQRHFLKVLFYILELAKCDQDYDIRDRGRMLESFLKSMPVMPLLEGISHAEPINTHFHGLILAMLCQTKRSESFTIHNFRLHLPGSLSQIVLHAAPGYTPLPHPCSLNDISPEKVMSEDITEPVNLSGLSYEGSQSSYDSEDSMASTVESENAISVCDDKENETASSAVDLDSLMSKSALENWLNEQPSLPAIGSSSSSPPRAESSSARISINEIELSIKPKLNVLLDASSGCGLRVYHYFTSEISEISRSYVCSEVVFENLSSEPLKNISLLDDRSAEKDSELDTSRLPTIVPMEEIECLQPGDVARRVAQVLFHHHLLPVKLAIFCDGKRHPIKFQPDIGYFMRPLVMDYGSFTKLEIQLRGMFEYTRRCLFSSHINALEQSNESPANDDRILAVCHELASKMLSSASICLVSVDMPVSLKFDEVSDLCLRFSGEILNSSKPCLVTLLAEGKCSEPLDISVKVNCEETVFGLNLLNRIISFLSSDSSSP